MARRRPRLSPLALKEPDRELTTKQRRFVAEFLANGGRQRDAALAAGYPPKSADVTASRLVRNPVVQQHLAREMMQQLGLDAVMALATMRSLAKSANSEYVQQMAAKDLLDRAGFAPPDRQQLQIDGQLTVSIDVGGPKTVDGTDSHPPQHAVLPSKVS